MCSHALISLYHFAVKHFWQDNMSVKQARAVLVGNAKHIAKTSGGDQQRGLAFSLKQSVGRHCGAHAYAGNAIRRNRFMGL